MQLKALKISNPKLDSDMIWKVGGGRRSGAEVYVFKESNSDLLDLAGSLSHLFSDTVDQLQSTATIRFVDERGCPWTWQKKSYTSSLFRKDKAIDTEELARSLMMSLLGTESDESSALVRLVDLSIDGAVLSLKDKDPVEKATSELAELINGTQNSVLRDLSKKIQFSNNINLKEKLSFIEKTERYYYSLMTYQNQLKSSKVKSVQSVEHQNQLDSLQSEVKLLNEISGVAEPLLDPSKSQRVIKDRIVKLEAKIEHLMNETGLKSKETLAGNIPWHHLIKCLGNKIVQEALLAASDKALDRYHSKIEPIESAYTESLREVIEQDGDMIEQIENCLSKLGETERRLNAPTVSQKMSNSIKKFVQPSLKDESGELLPLEKAQKIVQLVLTKLSRLQVHIREITDSPKDSLESLNSFHEKISQNLLQTKSNWKRYCDNYRLPEDLTLEKIILLISQSSSLLTIQNERDELEKKQRDRKQQLRHLEALIRNWRKISKSQKTSDLSNSSVLIAETQTVLRSSDGKKKILLKLEQQLSESLTEQALQDSVQKKRQRLVEQWTQSQTGTIESAPDLNSSEWSEIFHLKNQLRAFAVLSKHQSEKNVIRGERAGLFSPSLAPWTVCRIQDDKFTDDHLNDLCRQIELCPPDRPLFILTSRQDVATSLLRVGCGMAQRIVQAQQRTVDTNKQVEKSELSQKAQQALDAFQHRSTQGRSKTW